jgi:hypothetical protein
MNKWALLVGINEYPNLAKSNQLHGCVNDARSMADILMTKFGFAKDNIKLLCDADATRDGILAGMRWLTDRAADNDVTVFHYSGHGSQMTDREGDETDGMDETIVPSDSGRGIKPNRDITDDEIYAWLVELTQKTAFVTLIFDSCHSGTVTRDLDFGTGERTVDPDTRPVAELPPSPFAGKMPSTFEKDLGASEWVPLDDRYVLIAGCRDEERSYEHDVLKDGSPSLHGALTYFLVQELAKAQPQATYRDVFEPASIQVAAAYPRQHPQMEGSWDRLLFGVQDLQPVRFVPVIGRDGSQVTLGAGAAHGLTVRSQWAIYPPGTKRPGDGVSELGRVEVTSVQSLQSLAKITEEAQPGAISVASRAFETAHFYGEMRLVVSIKAPDPFRPVADELKGLIDQSDLLRLAEPGENADVCAYIIDRRATAGPQDPVPQLVPVDEPVWAVVGQDGQLTMPIHRTSQLGSALDIRDNLEKAVRYKQALAIRNSNPESALRDKVKLLLLQKNAAGMWVEAEPKTSSKEQREAAGQIIFEEGESIAVRITNEYDAPIYSSLLDLGLTGKISLLYPPPGAQEQLLPKRSIDVGNRPGSQWTPISVPRDFPYAREYEKDVPAGGVETLKLLVTTQPADFRQLVQQGYRDIGPDRGMDSPLGRLLDMALTGYGTRDVEAYDAPADAEWTTVEQPFYLKKKQQAQ